MNDSTLSGSVWDKVWNTATSLGSAWLSADIQTDVAKANKKVAEAQARAAQAQSSGWLKFALIGGGVLAAIVALFLVFRK